MLVTGCGRLLMLLLCMGVNVGRTGVQQQAVEVANRRRGNCLEKRQNDQQRDRLANHRFYPTICLRPNQNSVGRRNAPAPPQIKNRLEVQSYLSRHSSRRDKVGAAEG